MARYSNDRGAINDGGASAFGAWRGDHLLLDETNADDNPVHYDDNGVYTVFDVQI